MDWRTYIQEFNENDEELFVNDISNEHCLEFLENEIPIVELPDKVIERAYYFRWWTYRKHIKTIPGGHIITEFLPPVSWAGNYNEISCPSGFHIREGRWLKDESGILKDYIRFWLSFPEKLYVYSTWLVWAVEEYCEIHGDWEFAEEMFERLELYFERRLEHSGTDTGLFYSQDGADGMEVGISGHGLRPTINSYIWADAMALSRLADRKGLKEKSEKYREFAQKLKTNMENLLWTEGFFHTIPEKYMKEPCVYQGIRPHVPVENFARELIGYVPWYFNIPEPEKAGMFDDLLKSDGFYTPYGLTVAEQSHPRFMEPFPHECLWNGPIWPFATTQTLTALSNALHGDTSYMYVTKADYVKLLHQYAASFKRTLPDGKVVDWIDENMDPANGEWLARRILESQNWPEELGGPERGKDYNHSMYCDLVLSGLLGIQAGENGSLEVKPLIPDDWEYFRVQNLHVHGRQYEITYDKDGTHFGGDSGVCIRKMKRVGE